jgi:hypothetical protein
MDSLYGIWLHTAKNEEYKFYGSMVEKSIKMASIANEQLLAIPHSLYAITIANL